MGTSSSGGGASGSNPLIPSWINSGDGLDNQNNSDIQSPQNDQQENGSSDNENANQDANIEPVNTDSNNTGQDTPVTAVGNRYTQPKKAFNKYIKSNGNNTSYLHKALKGYVRKGSGGSSVLSKRMRPSASRVVGFINTINDIKASGKVQILTQINLTTYINKPLNETLAALSDEIFKDTGKIYEDTQDDSITRQAYSNTIIRICELDVIDLDHLSNENVELMTSIFIEETIAQRVICDIGNNLTKITSDISKLLEIEDNVYQIISGLVRNQVMPELIATQRGNKEDLDKKIENIYRIAFDAIVGIKD